jgi:tRNA 2-selenouridine synthase
VPDYTRATVAQLAEFDTLIDVRSPAEYAEDHIPGAINCPVLSNGERIRVGTLYKQESPFAARKLGAVLVARNIAQHLETTLNQHPKSWRPLIYCWRGGQRSGAFTHILREIGWPARRLEGGYKSWRRHVLENLQMLPGGIRFRVIAGPTGSAKSRLLEALAAQGAQTLHLEQLAAHKGSVLGDLPDTPQPAQKMFDTRLYVALSNLDRTRPVFVEAESRQIGAVRLPESLSTAIRSSACLCVEASLSSRVAFLLQDYGYLCESGRLDAQLMRLKEIQGKERIMRWQELTKACDFQTLVTELLVEHYDPLYARSQSRNFAQLGQATTYVAEDLSSAGLSNLASRMLSDLDLLPD